MCTWLFFHRGRSDSVDTPLLIYLFASNTCPQPLPQGRKKNKDAAGTAVAGASAAAAAERAQRQSQGLDNFYRFQAREKRRDGASSGPIDMQIQAPDAATGAMCIWLTMACCVCLQSSWSCAQNSSRIRRGLRI